MDSIKKSITNTINERIASPLIGSFVISWAIWNYKTILILLSTKSVECKFEYIEDNIYFDNFDLALNGLVFPALTSLIFILIFPYPERWFYKYWYGHKQELEKTKQEIDNKKLLTKEESREIIRKSVELESEYTNIIDEKDLEIKNLKQIIIDNEKEPVDITEELVTIEKDVDAEEEKKMLMQKKSLLR